MRKIRLGEIDTRAPKDWDKQTTKEKTRKILEELNELQNLLYAESKHALLVILQGMDASGKDGVIRNVFSSFNPQGVRVKSFKSPTAEELSHDFLWRVHPHTPARLCLLLISKGEIGFNYLPYAGLVLLATICYGINVNMVSRYLKDVGSLNIASFAFSFLTIPSFLILYFTGYFQLPLHESSLLISSGAGIILGVMGTAVASIIFYMLVKRAGILFPSMVTYAIPFVAIFWGLLDHEGITGREIACLGIILVGVFLTNT